MAVLPSVARREAGGGHSVHLICQTYMLRPGEVSTPGDDARGQSPPQELLIYTYRLPNRLISLKAGQGGAESSGGGSIVCELRGDV